MHSEILFLWRRSSRHLHKDLWGRAVKIQCMLMVRGDPQLYCTADMMREAAELPPLATNTPVTNTARAGHSEIGELTPNPHTINMHWSTKQYSTILSYTFYSQKRKSDALRTLLKWLMTGFNLILCISYIIHWRIFISSSRHPQTCDFVASMRAHGAR